MRVVPPVKPLYSQVKFQCKLCNSVPEGGRQIETFEFCKPTWFLAIQSAMAYLMWTTQRKQFKVKEIHAFLLTHWDTLCWGFTAEHKQKDPANVFAKRRASFVQTSPYWELKELAVNPCPLLRGGSWVQPVSKKQGHPGSVIKGNADSVPPMGAEASEDAAGTLRRSASAGERDMETEIGSLGGVQAFSKIQASLPYQPSYGDDVKMSPQDLVEMNVSLADDTFAELEEDIAAIFQGNDACIFNPSFRGTVIQGQLSRQNSSRGLKRQASACDEPESSGAELVRPSSSRRRAQKAWSILRSQVSQNTLDGEAIDFVDQAGAAGPD